MEANNGYFHDKPVMLTSKYSSIDLLQHSHVKKVGPPDWAKLVPMVEQSSSRRVKRPRLRCLRPARMTGRGCPECLGGMVMLNRRGKRERLYMEVDGRLGLTPCRVVYTVLELEVMAVDRIEDMVILTTVMLSRLLRKVKSFPCALFVNIIQYCLCKLFFRKGDVGTLSSLRFHWQSLRRSAYLKTLIFIL